MIEESILQENSVLSMHTPKKQKQNIKVQGEIDRSTIFVGDFNTPHQKQT